MYCIMDGLYQIAKNESLKINTTSPTEFIICAFFCTMFYNLGIYDKILEKQRRLAMKNKALIAVLSLICVVSVGFNIYLYNVLNTSRQQLSDTQAQLDSMTKSYAELESQLTAMQEELDALNINMADKQSEIDSLTKDNNNLMSSISELEESIVEVADNTESEEANKEDTTTSQQTTDTASTTNNTASNQNVDAATQAEVLEKAAANGFAIGGYDTEYVDHVVERDMSGQVVSVWE